MIMPKRRDDKSNQTIAAQNRLSWLKQPQVWLPISSIFIILLITFLRVEGQPFQWKVTWQDRTGFGKSYDDDALTVIEKGTETTGTSKKETTKTTTTIKRLQSAKTLWDWMTLLLAPATLAGLGFLFQSSQEKAKRDKEEADKARTADQQREQALQTYFDQLSALLVDKQLKKLLTARHAAGSTQASAEEGVEASSVTVAMTAKPELSIDAKAALDVVKARTLSLLRLFDEDIPRKASVLSFLADADLLNQLKLDLSRIKLEGANLKKVNFSACDFHDANLSSANFNGANLNGANFNYANLNGANFNGANLNGTRLESAILTDAHFFNANLVAAELFNARLTAADLVGSDLSGAKLESANLIGAKLMGTKLIGANLIGANLIGANLLNADLADTELFHAKFWDTQLTGDNLERAKKHAMANIQLAANWQKARFDSKIHELLIPKKASEAELND